MTFCEKIIYCRKRAGLSQIDLADQLGVSRQTISKWETGESNPEINKLPALAKALGVSIDWLLSESGPEEEPVKKTEEPVPAVINQDPAERTGKVWKQYGWIAGVVLAAYGGWNLVKLALSLVQARQMIFGESSAYNLVPEVQQNTWTNVVRMSIPSGIFSIVLLTAGIILAVVLKRRQRR